VYRKAAVCGHLTEDCTEQKMRLFKHLHFLFQQDSEKRSDTARTSEINGHRPSDPTLVLNLIRQQEPIARLLIFLRHCEGLSLEQVSRITGQAPIAIQSRLREFRSSLRRVLDNGLQPAMDWSNVSPARSSQSA
jgi:DNA-directed RNA polymerase specialized sigma24 family protein